MICPANNVERILRLSQCVEILYVIHCNYALSWDDFGEIFPTCLCFIFLFLLDGTGHPIFIKLSQFLDKFNYEESNSNFKFTDVNMSWFFFSFWFIKYYEGGNFKKKIIK